MKKILCAWLALVLMASMLAGCSGKEEEESSVPEEVSQTSPAPETTEGYTMGIVQYMEYAPLDEAREAFISRLDEWGFDDGQVKIDYQNAGGKAEKAQEICEQFVKDKKDVIVAISSPAAKAAIQSADKGETKVVFLAVSDPQTELGISNPASPEGNVTGVADLVAAQAALELARQVNPKLASAGLLYDPACPFGTAYVQAFKNACAQMEIAVVEGQAANGGEVKQRMEELCPQVDAVFSPVDSTVAAAAQEAAKTAQEAGKPWYTSTQDTVQQGAMASIGIDYTEAGNKAADMAVQLAVGKDVSQLPVHSFTSGQISVNQASIAALEATVPEDVLGTAIYCQPKT